MAAFWGAGIYKTENADDDTPEVETANFRISCPWIYADRPWNLIFLARDNLCTHGQ